jgi:integrase
MSRHSRGGTRREPSPIRFARERGARRREGKRTQRAIPKFEGHAWTDEQLRHFLRTAVGHRYFPTLWLAAMTGMRRNEVLGLQWPDIDFRETTRRTQPRTDRRRLRAPPRARQDPNHRRTIDLDHTTVNVHGAWRAYQAAEFAAVGIEHHENWVFTDGNGEPIHPHSLAQAFARIVRCADVPMIRFHDLRHTHGSLLIKEGVPVKVVSERRGHADIAHTIQTYQHLLPGMQADAARTYERLIKHAPPAPRRRNTRRNHP